MRIITTATTTSPDRADLLDTFGGPVGGGAVERSALGQELDDVGKGLRVLAEECMTTLVDPQL